MPPQQQSKLSAKAKASQEIVPIEEIRDGVVILKDGSLRAVLMASSLNFALKSADEQEAIILQYQNFLNSLDFSIQFFVESRKLNIEPYLDTLRERKRIETNSLLKIQITEYITFVKDFVENGNIVSKSFYIVVPFIPATQLNIQKPDGGIAGMFSGIFGGKKEGGSMIDEAKFAEFKLQLWQRLDTVSEGLVRTGVRVVPLNTEELIELYYGLYNPEESEKTKVPDLGKVQ